MKQVNETIRLAVGNGLTARTVLSMALTTWVDHIEELHRFQCDYYGADSDNAGSTAVLLAEAQIILGQLSEGQPASKLYVKVPYSNEFMEVESQFIATKEEAEKGVKLVRPPYANRYMTEAEAAVFMNDGGAS